MCPLSMACMANEQMKNASREVWDAMAAGWDARHAWFEAMARPVTTTMLERAAVQAGDRVLDLASGTGVAGLAAAPLVGGEGRVILSDFAPSMVESARRQVERLGFDNVECRLLDAEQLDVPDDDVDAVLCRWGYMLMPGPGAAFKETRRVLRDGGRLACAVFSGPSDNAWAAVPMKVLVERGAALPPQPGSPGILALADTDRLRSLMQAADFENIDIEPVPLQFPFVDEDEYWGFMLEAAGAIAPLIKALDPAAQAEVRAEVVARLSEVREPKGFELPAVCLVASAS